MSRKPYVAVKEIRGRVRHFFRKTWITPSGLRRERYLELPADPDSAEYDREYWAIRTGTSARLRQDAERSLAALIAAYRRSPRYRRLAPSTRAKYDHYMALLEARNAGVDVRKITARQIRRIHEHYGDTPRKADWFVQVLSILLGHAIEPLEWIEANPAHGVRLFGPRRTYDPWPDDLLEAFARTAETLGEHHARTAMELAIGTGQRPGDVRKMAWADIADGYIRVVQEKAREAEPDEPVWVYLTDRLAAYLDALPRAGRHILPRNISEPISYAALEHSIRRVRAAVGPRAQGYVMHGWRANAAVDLAQTEASDAEIAAVTGHRSEKMVRKYRAKAQRRLLSKAGQMRRKAKRTPPT